MTYNPIKPDAGPSPALDASVIQTNFAQFAAIFSKTVGSVIYNHTPLNNFNEGDHECILFEKRTADLGVNQTLDVLYCKDAASKAGTQPQLFVQIPKFLPNQIDSTNAPNTPMQLTYNSVNTAGPVYQSFFAGGYLFYFGTVTALGTVIVSPAPTKLIAAIAAPNTQRLVGNQTPFLVSTEINTSLNDRFTIFSDVTGVFSISWMAVGTV